MAMVTTKSIMSCWYNATLLTVPNQVLISSERVITIVTGEIHPSFVYDIVDTLAIHRKLTAG